MLLLKVLLDDCEEAREAHVTSVKQRPKSKWRPTALDTIELEKLAVRKLHMSAKDAMAVAEKLYSRGKCLALFLTSVIVTNYREREVSAW